MKQDKIIMNTSAEIGKQFQMLLDSFKENKSHTGLLKNELNRFGLKETSSFMLDNLLKTNTFAHKT